MLQKLYNYHWFPENSPQSVPFLVFFTCELCQSVACCRVGSVQGVNQNLLADNKCPLQLEADLIRTVRLASTLKLQAVKLKCDLNEA